MWRTPFVVSGRLHNTVTQVTSALRTKSLKFAELLIESMSHH